MSQSGETVACLSRPQVWQPAAGCKWQTHRPTELISKGNIPAVQIKGHVKTFFFSPGLIQHQAWYIICPLHHQRPPEWDRLRGAQPAGQCGSVSLSQRNAYPLVWHNDQRQAGGAAQRNRPGHPLLVNTGVVMDSPCVCLLQSKCLWEGQTASETPFPTPFLRLSKTNI